MKMDLGLTMAARRRGSAASVRAPFSPTPPTLFAAPTSAEITVALSADPPDGGAAITRRDLRYSTDGGATWSVVTGVTSPVTLFSLSPATAHLIQWRAVNGVGEGAWSGSLSVSTEAGVPGAIAAPAVSTAIGQATITLGPNPADTGGAAITGIDWQADDAGFAAPDFSGSGVAGQEIVVSIPQGGVYTFRQRARNIIGPSASWGTSPTLTITPAATDFPPGSFTLLNPATDDDLTLRVITAPSDPAVTTAEYELNASGTWVEFATAEGFEIQGGALEYTSSVSATTVSFTVSAPAGLAGTYGPFTLADLDAGPLLMIPPAVTGTTTVGSVRTIRPGVWFGDDAAAPLLRFGRLLRGATLVSETTLDPTAADPTYTIQSGDLEPGMTWVERAVDANGERLSAPAVILTPRFPNIMRIDVGSYEARPSATVSPATATRFTIAMRFTLQDASRDFDAILSPAGFTGMPLINFGSTVLRAQIQDSANTNRVNLSSVTDFTLVTPRTLSIMLAVDYTRGGDLGASVLAKFRISGESTLSSTATAGTGIYNLPANNSQFLQFFTTRPIDLHQWLWVSFSAALDPDTHFATFFDTANGDAVRNLGASGVVGGVTPDLYKNGGISHWQGSTHLGSRSTWSFGPGSGTTITDVTP